MDLWDWIVWFFWIYIFFAYLMVLFSIIADIFRDSTLNGWLKAVWVFFLIFVPIITALVYLIARGRSMEQRGLERMESMRRAQDEYIREAAGTTSPADEIAKARSLLETGAITQAEFDALKAKTLAS
jgi:Phospholipase_D-nuclease N-terminal